MYHNLFASPNHDEVEALWWWMEFLLKWVAYLKSRHANHQPSASLVKCSTGKIWVSGGMIQVNFWGTFRYASLENNMYVNMYPYVKHCRTMSRRVAFLTHCNAKNFAVLHKKMSASRKQTPEIKICHKGTWKTFDIFDGAKGWMIFCLEKLTRRLKAVRPW